MAGSIEKRSDDSYRLRFTYNNIVNRKVVYCRTKNEAKILLDKFVSEVRNGKIKSNSTFKEISEYWYKSTIKDRISHRSAEQYKAMLDDRIYLYFANMLISEITQAQIIDFFNSMSKELSYKTLKNYKACLNSIFKKAISWDIISKNPCSDFELPKGIKKEEQIKYLTPQEISLFLTCLKNEKLCYQAVGHLALACGLRRGEIVALKWNDIDFKNKLIRIRHSMSVSKEYGKELKEPKTKSSIRDIYGTNDLFEILKILPKNNEYIFDFSINRIYKWFIHFMNKNKLPKITFHDLRHTHATTLIANNVNLKSVSARLGHSNISTTMNIYTHALREKDKDIANTLNNILK